MATDMDIDMDLDLGPLPEEQMIEVREEVQIQQEQAPIDSDIPLAYTDQTLDIQPNKVHIRGLDEATTDNVREFAKTYFTLAEPTRIEWIDDTSANIIYSTKEFASKALDAFTLDLSNPAIAANILEPRVAKSMPAKPESMLQVRPALFDDKKKAKAHEASRFYMMHPEHDPRERMRIERQRGGRGGGENGDYNRRRYDDREHRRRRDHDNGDDSTANFDASMYDDDGGDDDRRPSSEGRGRDLFSRSSGRRNRSASPSRHSDNSDHGRRFRSRNSPPRRRRDKNTSKELFPSNGESLLQREIDAPPSRELFPQALTPNKTFGKNIKRELFPHKTSVSNHRRTDAFDAAAAEAAELMQKSQMMDGPRELFPSSTDDSGMNIRGSAGMSIKGGAGINIKGRGNKEIKELFPQSYGDGGNRNKGKELFSDILEGRGGRRRKAEDMFG